MRTLRVLYTVVIVASLGLASALYYRYQLKDRELAQYQSLNDFSSRALRRITTELNKSLEEKEKLNKIIASLEKEKVSFKGELQAAKEERAKLQINIARLLEERTVLEIKLISLVKKFESLEELKKAIKIAKKEKHRRGKIEKMQRRLAKIEMLRALDEIALQQGNRGFMVMAGQSTVEPKAKVTVELEPVNKR